MTFQMILKTLKTRFRKTVATLTGLIKVRIKKEAKKNHLIKGVKAQTRK